MTSFFQREIRVDPHRLHGATRGMGLLGVLTPQVSMPLHLNHCGRPSDSPPRCPSEQYEHSHLISKPASADDPRT